MIDALSDFQSEHPERFLFGASVAPFAKSLDYPEEEWESDFQKMQEVNITAGRCYVAWDRVEQKEGELDFHETNLFEAFDGLTVYDNIAYSPIAKFNSVGESETDSTAIYFPFFPSCATRISSMSEPALIIIVPFRSYSSFSDAEKIAVHS